MRLSINQTRSLVLDVMPASQGIETRRLEHTLTLNGVEYDKYASRYDIDAQVVPLLSVWAEVHGLSLVVQEGLH